MIHFAYLETGSPWCWNRVVVVVVVTLPGFLPVAVGTATSTHRLKPLIPTNMCMLWGKGDRADQFRVVVESVLADISINFGGLVAVNTSSHVWYNSVELHNRALLLADCSCYSATLHSTNKTCVGMTSCGTRISVSTKSNLMFSRNNGHCSLLLKKCYV